MASKLYVGGLSYSTTSDGLREFFAQSGNVLSATVITDRFSGQSRGFGFVEMDSAEGAQNAISQLNGRELEVVRLVAQGATNPQVARRLYVSESTVKYHLRIAMRKLGAKDSTELVYRASTQGVM